MNTANFPWLTTAILFPIAASLLIPFIPDKDGKTVRWYALIVGLIDFSLIVYAFGTQYDFDKSGLQLVESYPWIPQLDLNWSVGADGIAMPLILLTGFITTLANFSSLAGHSEAKAVLLFTSGYVWRSTCSVCRPRYVAVFPGLGAGAGSGILFALNLGGQKASVRCNKVHSLHSWWVTVYFAGCPDNGFLWRYGDI